MDHKELPASRRMVKGPKGSWKVTAAAPCEEAQQEQRELLELSERLAGFDAPKLRLP
jgi:hypothetical protein